MSKKGVSILSWILKKIRNGYIKRKIDWRKLKESKFKTSTEELGIEKQRVIELFLTLIKDKSSSLNHSPESKSRFVDSVFLWTSMYSAKDSKNYIINIIDNSIADNPHSHEFLISEEHAYRIMDVFDSELEKRFKALESDNKKILVSDIDKLILKIKEKK